MAKGGIPEPHENRKFSKPFPYQNLEIPPLIRREALARELDLNRIKSLI